MIRSRISRTGRRGPGRARQQRSGQVRSAFTLIELLLVLVILAILAGVVVLKFRGRPEQAKNTAAHTDINALDAAIEAFYQDTGRYPRSDEGLNALMVKPGDLRDTDWHGPYAKNIPDDPWHHPYVYRWPGTHNSNGFDLLSFGPDGNEGGNDDIDNWSKQ